MPPQADERWAALGDGAVFAGGPHRLLTQPISEIPRFVERGNIRPLGRFVDYVGHFIDWHLARLLGWSIVDAYSLTRVLALTLLALALYWAGARLGGSALVGVVAAVGFGALVGVGADAGSPLFVFPWLYWLTGALCVAAIPLLHQAFGSTATDAPGWWPGVVGTSLGIAVALFNEMVAATIALAAAALVWVQITEAHNTAAPSPRCPGVSAVKWFVGSGALSVLMIRAWFTFDCGRRASEHACYEGSRAELSGFLGHWFSRVQAGMLGLSGTVSDWTGIAPARSALGLTAALLAASGLVLAEAVRRRRTATAQHESDGWDRASLLVLAGLVLTAFGAAVGGMSAEVHRLNLGSTLAWRDAVLTTPGLALAGAGVLLAAADMVPQPPRRTAVLVAAILPLAIIGVANLRTNRQVSHRVAAQPNNQWLEAAADEFRRFDRSPTANRARCEAVARVEDPALGFDEEQARSMRLGLDVAARRVAGQPFCRD